MFNYRRTSAKDKELLFDLIIQSLKREDQIRSEVLNLEKLYTHYYEKPQPKTNLYRIDINLSSDKTLKDLIKQTQQISKWKFIKRYAYCYETCTSGKPHSHMLIELEEGEYKHFKQNMSRQKYPVYYKRNKSVPQPILITNIDEWNKCLKYIQGYKKGNFKDNHENDINFRKKNDLLDIYLSCPSESTIKEDLTNPIPTGDASQ